MAQSATTSEYARAALCGRNNQHGRVLSVHCRGRPPACELERIMPETVVIGGGRARDCACLCGAGQLTNEPPDPGQSDNLSDPVPGDPDTHGRFDSRAVNCSLQLWATEHRGALVAGTLALATFFTTMIAGSKPLARVDQMSRQPAR